MPQERLNDDDWLGVIVVLYGTHDFHFRSKRAIRGLAYDNISDYISRGTARTWLIKYWLVPKSPPPEGTIWLIEVMREAYQTCHCKREDIDAFARENEIPAPFYSSIFNTI